MISVFRHISIIYYYYYYYSYPRPFFLAQFGWAAVQVSHLALIPDLSNEESEREELNLIR